MSNYQELSSMSRSELREQKCSCIHCDYCSGKGFVVFPDTFGGSADNTESCLECNGSGVSELCDRCQVLAETGEGLER